MDPISLQMLHIKSLTYNRIVPDLIDRAENATIAFLRLCHRMHIQDIIPQVVLLGLYALRVELDDKSLNMHSSAETPCNLFIILES